MEWETGSLANNANNDTNAGKSHRPLSTDAGENMRRSFRKGSAEQNCESIELGAISPKKRFFAQEVAGDFRKLSRRVAKVK